MASLTLEEVWENILEEMQKVNNNYKIFTEKAAIRYDIDPRVIIIETPNVFHVRQLETKYDEAIKRGLEKSGVDFTHVRYLSGGSSEKIKLKPRSRELTEKVDQSGRRIIESVMHRPKPLTSHLPNRTHNGLVERFTMDNFVMGSNNDLAVSVAKNVIECPGTNYNPFFLYGGPGLGKTHLVQAIGNGILQNHPDYRILYIPINHFYSEFIKTIQKNSGDGIEGFRNKFRNLDVLIIDDFQFIVGKEKSQVEFFDIFNDLHQSGKQIIVTSDRLPNEIESVDSRLASRLVWGGAYDLQMPNFEDKCAILRLKAEYRGVEIEDGAIEYLAENVKTNIRDLEGEFTKLMALSELRGISPLKLIEDGCVGGITTSGSSRGVNNKQIIDKTAKHFNISSEELCGGSRVKNIKTARQVAMFLLSEELDMSAQQVAKAVGLKDHTTALHGIKKIREDMKLDFTLRSNIIAIKDKLHR